MITIGKTTYEVEALSTPGSYAIIGPRGGVYIGCPFIDNEDMYHFFAANGAHRDLKVNGHMAKVPRVQLEAAIS